MKRYQRIEDLRIDRDLSQEKMAQLMKTSKTQYQRYENSDGNNFFEAMIQISKIHNVSLDYIAGLTNDKGGLHKNSSEESELLSKYNALSDKRQGRVLQLLDDLTEEQQNEEAKTREVI
jgi:transcriptional regulator with XRE-family HTH domain